MSSLRALILEPAPRSNFPSRYASAISKTIFSSIDAVITGSAEYEYTAVFVSTGVGAFAVPSSQSVGTVSLCSLEQGHFTFFYNPHYC